MAVLPDPYWGRKALEFVDAAEAAPLPEDVFALFRKAIAELGFHAFIMAGVPLPGAAFEPLVLANGWPREWFEIYAREQLATVDPVPRYAMQTLNPFEWTEAPYDREHDKAADSVMVRARDFRFNNGFCIPIHYEDSTAAISMAGEKPDLTRETKSVLHLMGIYAHGRIRALTRPQRNPRRLLTDREREVLLWAAYGKTASEIAQILAISERTVVFHVTEAQHKLNAPNRVATVARAIASGEIKIRL